MSLPSSPPPPQSPPSGTHRTRTLVLIALVAALVAGVLGLGVGGLGGVLLSSGLSGSGSRTEHDVEQGCAIVERLEEELPLTADGLELDGPLVYELMAAGSLFMAAGYGDDDEALLGAGRDLVGATNRLDVEVMNETYDVLRSECAAR